jgi:hypothetical protein
MAERVPPPEAVAKLLAGREAFLDAHHVEAARRLARLFDQAMLRQRVTMSYDPARVGGRGSGTAQAELADSAADARKRLNCLAAQMPRDCWDVLWDVCALDSGLGNIEQRRGWPRRSAKLALRISLDQLAQLLGLSDVAEGGPRPTTAWLPERLPMFPDAPG